MLLCCFGLVWFALLCSDFVCWCVGVVVRDMSLTSFSLLIWYLVNGRNGVEVEVGEEED